MTNLPSALNGFLLSLALITAIGAQNAFVLRQGLRREHVGLVVIFCALADFILISAGVAGLGGVLDRVPMLSSVLALGGAAFLVVFGITAMRRALRLGDGLEAARGGPREDLGRTLTRVAGITLLNPHVYLDTVVLMGAVGVSHGGAGQGWFIAGAGAASTLWFGCLGFGARLLAPLFARPRAYQVLDGVVGLTMIAIAFALIGKSWSSWDQANSDGTSENVSAAAFP